MKIQLLALWQVLNSLHCKYSICKNPSLVLSNNMQKNSQNSLHHYLTGVCRKQQRKLEKSTEISRRLGKDEVEEHVSQIPP